MGRKRIYTKSQAKKRHYESFYKWRDGVSDFMERKLLEIFAIYDNGNGNIKIASAKYMILKGFSNKEMSFKALLKDHSKYKKSKRKR